MSLDFVVTGRETCFPGTFLVFEVAGHHQGNGQPPAGSSQAPPWSGYTSPKGPGIYSPRRSAAFKHFLPSWVFNWKKTKTKQNFAPMHSPTNGQLTVDERDKIIFRNTRLFSLSKSSFKYGTFSFLYLFKYFYWNFISFGLSIPDSKFSDPLDYFPGFPCMHFTLFPLQHLFPIFSVNMLTIWSLCFSVHVRYYENKLVIVQDVISECT